MLERIHAEIRQMLRLLLVKHGYIRYEILLGFAGYGELLHISMLRRNSMVRFEINFIL